MSEAANPITEFQTQSKRHLLDDLVAKLETLPPNDPDELRLIRIILGLRHELECGPPIQGEPL
jgi:hypothetical protein